VKDEEFAAFAKVLKERSGIVLTRDKEYLLESRLLPVARQHNRDSLSALARDLAVPGSPIEKDVIEAMTTNESFFFRDAGVFERFGSVVMPALIAARAKEKKIRIWSAACSSGQEAYSLAMMLSEPTLLPAGWQFEILGTDLATKMVERARAGTYNHFEIQRGLPVRHLAKHFTKNGDIWTISEKIRGCATFRPFNLLQDFAGLGQFDVIFCRNVLIYFDLKTKADILQRMSKLLRPEGFLFLGGAETVVGVTDRFVARPGQPGIYVHAAAAASAPAPLQAKVAV
jgi:chemotaxis protein methyltransferase CheR